MKRPHLFPAAIVALALALSHGLSQADPATLTVVKVEDGDTLLVAIDGLKKRIQLAGIDAPEAVANPKLTRDIQRTGLKPEELLPLGKSATEHLQSLVQPGEELETAGTPGSTDRYGRIPAVVIGKDGRSLNAAMVEDGYAIALEDPAIGKSLSAELKRLEEAAVAGNRGLWGSEPGTTRKWGAR